MKIVLVGPGRAGMSLAIAAMSARHEIVAILGRTVDSAKRAAKMVGAAPLTIGDDLPAADLLIIATRDEAIGAVAGAVAANATEIGAAVHVSGLTSVAALAPLAAAGIATGSFHPLQTLPTPKTGAANLAGSYIAITATEPLLSQLQGLATDLGANGFELSDANKPLYHAAAAAAANFPLAALTMASDLFAEAGVPWKAAQPLVAAVVDNAFEMGPRAALTGPVARGDVETVASQLRAVEANAPQWRVPFARLVEVLAKITGRADQFEKVLHKEEESR